MKNNFFSFVKECYAELKKVTWPSREDVVAQVWVVVISLVIVAAALALIDLGSREVVGFIIDRAGS